MNKKFVSITCIFLFYISFFNLIQNTAHPWIEKGDVMNDGKTLYVGGSGPNNYTKIQDAIDNASDGDTIFVYSGVYKENLIINKSIKLIGENRKTTIIDGQRKNHTISIFSNNVIIKYFTIQNGSDAGIYAKASEKLVIENNIIVNNALEGISIWRSSHCIIYGNTVKNDRWGICLYGSYYNIVSHNNLIGNEENMHIYYWKKWPLFWTNRFNRNFWDNWIGIIPKPIIAFFYPLYPLIQFDWCPLIFPYNFTSPISLTLA